MKTQLLTLLACFFVFSSLSAQYIGVEEIDESQLSAWQSPSGQDYIGEYHFGESEDESTLRIAISDQIVCAQIVQGSWGDDGSWITTYRNLHHVSIVGNAFFSNEYKGEFVQYKQNGKAENGLKIRDSWSGSVPQGQYEVGIRVTDLSLSGDYPQASIRFLTDRDIDAMTTAELQIMRNEIFARYGYQFREGGKMLAHFSQTGWYQPQHKNVDDFLTEIERTNISLIRAQERGER